MNLTVPNLPVINKENPKLGEALKAVEASVNLNVTPKTGNKVICIPTSIVDPTQRPG